MNKNISFTKLKPLIKIKGFDVTEVAEKCGLAQSALSCICTDRRFPMTDLVAKICSVLRCYPSEFISFDDINIKECFSDDKREKLPDVFTGELTYKPLWFFLADYLRQHEGKTANDLFNQIEPPRRLKGVKAPDEETIKKALSARFGEGYKSKRVKRTDYSKGLTEITRNKLRNDKPLQLNIIYEICKKLGCTIDFVLSYK